MLQMMEARREVKYGVYLYSVRLYAALANRKEVVGMTSESTEEGTAWPPRRYDYAVGVFRQWRSEQTTRRRTATGRSRWNSAAIKQARTLL